MSVTLSDGTPIASLGDLTVLANVQSWLNFAGTAGAQVLPRLISAESLAIQNYLNRTIGLTAYTEVRDGLGAGIGMYRMSLGNHPIASVQSLTIDDIQIPPSTDGGVLQAGYAFDKTQLWLSPVGSIADSGFGLGYAFAKGLKNIVIQYTAGYATIPFDVEQACIELVALRFQERTRIGLVSQAMQGQTTSYTQKAMSDSILNTLNHYKNVVPL